MQGILTEMLIDKYKKGEISLRNLLQELTNLNEFRESRLYDSLCLIDTRRILDLPDELASLMVDIALVDKPKSVIDINCSTGKLLNFFPSETLFKGYNLLADEISIGRLIYPNLNLFNENPIHKNFSEKFDCVISCLPREDKFIMKDLKQNTSLVYLKRQCQF
ncbi:hypothetical protein H1D32_24175 [Anaerobacillus sp. CMMVII]|uniref:hypothetical protein n=1 Tax=Anaerobacillus sp. CMMVII TaxID=2755588 RepID=UPI0021B73788|nr:hypothetical protein [Anaerobacillus sp. CMMVII]MCT8140498.1 hypothetical protein [Anaerobacillus sp. CMMVII]